MSYQQQQQQHYHHRGSTASGGGGATSYQQQQHQQSSNSAAQRYQQQAQQQQNQQNQNNDNNADENRERLRRFYEKVNPSKLEQLDEILDDFAGNEEVLFQELEKKYNMSTQLGGQYDHEFQRQKEQEQQQEEEEKKQQIEQQKQQQHHQQGAFGNTQALLTPEQAAAHELARMPQPLLPESAQMQRFTHETLPQMQKSLSQIQDAYGKLAESIAVANSRGVDVSKSAAWVVSAQLGAANFLASAKQFLHLASDEDRRMKDVHSSLSAVNNATSGGGVSGGIVRATSTRVAAVGNNQQQHQDRSSSSSSPQQRQQQIGSTSTKRTTTAGSTRVIFDVTPIGGERHVVSDLIHSHAHAGDLIILHPGIYYENLVLRQDVEIRVASTTSQQAGGGSGIGVADRSATSAIINSPNSNLGSAAAGGGGGAATGALDPDQQVIFLPSDTSMPTIQVVGESRCVINGIQFAKGDRNGVPLLENAAQFVENGPAHQDGVPHVSLTGKSKVRFENCTLTSGGGGIVCVGRSELTASYCLFRGNAFAAVYAKDASLVEMVDVRCSDCEIGVRIRDATLTMLRCEVVRSVADGIILHGGARSELERCVIADAGANGMLLSSASQLALTDCRIISCGKWGVDAPRGANFAVHRGMIVKNLLGPLSRQPNQSK